MSVVAIIKQKKIIPKKIGLEFLNKWAEKEGLYFGEPGEAWEWQNYSGSEDLREHLLILCDGNGYGRGVSMMVHKNYSIELTLALPPTSWDIELFYRMIESLCHEFGQTTFIHEEKKCTLEQLGEIKKEITGHMKRFVKTKLAELVTIYGCVYPIVIEQEFIDSISHVNEDEAFRMYGEYLNGKQTLECGYVYALVMGKPGDEALVAQYVVSKDICMIFPVQKELPFGYSKATEDKIVRWGVVVAKEGGVVLQCTHDQFCSIVDIEKYPKFDAKHVLITVDDAMIQFIKSELRKLP